MDYDTNSITDSDTFDVYSDTLTLDLDTNFDTNFDTKVNLVTPQENLVTKRRRLRNKGKALKNLCGVSRTAEEIIEEFFFMDLNLLFNTRIKELCLYKIEKRLTSHVVGLFF